MIHIFTILWGWVDRATDWEDAKREWLMQHGAHYILLANIVGFLLCFSGLCYAYRRNREKEKIKLKRSSGRRVTEFYAFEDSRVRARAMLRLDSKRVKGKLHKVYRIHRKKAAGVKRPLWDRMGDPDLDEDQLIKKIEGFCADKNFCGITGAKVFDSGGEVGLALIEGRGVVYYLVFCWALYITPFLNRWAMDHELAHLAQEAADKSITLDTMGQIPMLRRWGIEFVAWWKGSYELIWVIGGGVIWFIAAVAVAIRTSAIYVVAFTFFLWAALFFFSLYRPRARAL